MLSKNELLNAIEPFPLLNYCFSRYIHYLYRKAGDSLVDNDLIGVIQDGGTDQLAFLEGELSEARDILGIDDETFRRDFGFKHDLLTPDPEKIYDILFEPELVVYLSKNGFTDIQKLRKKSTPSADFVANFGTRKFAIETKVVRPQILSEPVRSRSGSRPNWGLDEIYQVGAQRIREAVVQLDATRKELRCDYVMPVVDIRRDTRVRMSRSGYVHTLKRLKDEFPELHYIGCKAYDNKSDYRSSSLLVYPELTS